MAWSSDSGSRFRFEGFRGSCQRVPWTLSSHCSHIRRISLKDRLLLCLLPPSRRKNNFGEAPRGPSRPGCHCVTDRAGKKATGPSLFGCLCEVRSEWKRVERTSFKSGKLGCRGRSMNRGYGIVEGKLASGTARSGPGRDRTTTGPGPGLAEVQCDASPRVLRPCFVVQLWAFPWRDGQQVTGAGLRAKGSREASFREAKRRPGSVPRGRWWWWWVKILPMDFSLLLLTSWSRV